MKLAQFLIHLIVPGVSNNHKSKLLHPSTLTLLIIGLVLYKTSLYFLPFTGLKVLGYAANISPAEVIRLTNEKRQKEGLLPLEENSVLSQAALAKGTDMINKSYWAHVSPDGIEPWTFFTNFGYKFKYAGENLARDFSTPQTAVDAWVVSPSHRENLLSEKYKDIGIAVVEGNINGVETTIIVQFFGTKVGEKVALVPDKTPGQIVPEKGEVLTNNKAIGNKILISPFVTTKTASLILLSILLATLILDGIIVSRKKVIRISGRTVAHLSFLATIILIITILKAGEIL